MAQLIELCFGLDTFGDGEHAELAGEHGQHVHQRAGGSVVQALYEGLVDFENIKGHGAQMAKRRMAGAEVIKGNADPF